MGKTFVVTDDGQVSDGHHTFAELYKYRMMFNAAWFEQLAKQGLYDVHKSRLHHDGSFPFGDQNMFIVVAELPQGQISNHYKLMYWDFFKVPIKQECNLYDGHTPEVVAQRISRFLLG